MVFSTCVAGSFTGPDFCLIFAPRKLPLGRGRPAFDFRQRLTGTGGLGDRHIAAEANDVVAELGFVGGDGDGDGRGSVRPLRGLYDRGRALSPSCRGSVVRPVEVYRAPWRADFFVLSRFPMAVNTVITRKKRGPPPTGKGTLIGVRLQPTPLANVDAWAASQEDKPSRPEAIRRLIEIALTKTVKPGKR
jgi:hypothetical protein